MNLILHKHHRTLLVHVIIWTVLLLMPYFISTAESGYAIGLIPGVFFTVAGVIHIGVFYGNAFLLYPLFFNKRFWWLYLLLSIGLIYASIYAKYYISMKWFPAVLENRTAYKFVFGPSVAFFF